MPLALLKTAIIVAQNGSRTPPEWRIRWTWDWPLWLTVFVAIGAFLWVMAVYFREAPSVSRGMRLFLIGLRCAALALAMVMLAQPVLEWYRLGRPRLIVLVDRSASMSTLDRYDDADAEISRLEVVQQLLTKGEQSLLEHWQSNYELELIGFAERSERLDEAPPSLGERLRELQPAGEIAGDTRLGDAIDHALRQLPGPTPVALIVLSDGISTRGQSLAQGAQQARQFRVPLYTVEIGSDRRRRDVSLENVFAEEIVFPGDRLQVEATIRATGYARQQAKVALRDDVQGVLAETALTLPAEGETASVRLTIRPDEPGELNLELAVEPLNGETNLENNTIRQVVQVRDEKIRVLLVQSEPSYEYRALKSMLERDPAVELRTLLQEADADFATVDDFALRAFPHDEKELFSYDVLILGDVDRGLLPWSVWPLVERFVTIHGGGMVGIAGPRFMPLSFRGVPSMELLLPIILEPVNPLRAQLTRTEGFAVYPTDLGWRTSDLQLAETTAESERIWRALPPVLWLLQVDEMKPGAQVLAEHPGITNRRGRRLPVVIRHYVGAGEVLFHATDETWRWRWRTDDRYFARYWGQVVRRLGRGRLVSGRTGVQLSTDRSSYEPGEAVELYARFRNPSDAPSDEAGVVIQLQRRIGPAREISMQRKVGLRGVFSARVENLQPGEYQMLLVRPDTQGPMDVVRFAIRQPPRELAQLVVNRQGLMQAAKTSGGRHYTLANAARLSSELPPPRKQTIDTLPPRPLWNSHVLLALFVAVLTSEWLLRRRSSML